MAPKAATTVVLRPKLLYLVRREGTANWQIHCKLVTQKKWYRKTTGTIVYNNYVFPKNVSNDLVDEITNCANAVLKARLDEEMLCAKNGTKATLAAMYTAGAMPINLLKAHKTLDKAVDKAYGYTGADDDASRVAFMFNLYEKETSLLAGATAKKKRVKAA